MGKFEIFTGVDGMYYFRLKARNGEIIAISEGYTTKQACRDTIKSVRVNAPFSRTIDKTK
jgi:uncharacterized protein YegP (UPF0339 family)